MNTYKDCVNASNWVRVDRPDIEEYHSVKPIKGYDCELWWDDQEGVVPGWCVRVSIAGKGEQDIPVKGRRDSKIQTIHKNVLAAL